MLKVDEIQIGNIASSEIIDFSFSEGQLCGLTKGSVLINKKMNQEELDLIRTVSVSIYPNSRLYHAKIDEYKKQTTLYFSELHNVNNYVAETVTTYSGTNVGSITYDIVKKALNTTTITMDTITTSAFSGTISFAGYGQNLLQFGLSIYDFAYLRYNTTTNLYHVHSPSDRYFSLGNPINNNVTLSVTPTSVPNTYITEDFFEVVSVTVFCPYNDKVVLNTKGFYDQDISSTTEHNPLSIFMSYVYSDINDTILASILPFLKANYVAVKGLVIKEGIELNVGDTVVYGDYQGVINKIERKLEHDVIYFGFPPFPKMIAHNKEEERVFQYLKTKNPRFEVWDDIQFPITNGKVPAVNYPNYETLTTNTRGYAFGINEYIDLESEEMSHGWQESSTVYPHVHFTLKSATTAVNYVKFTIYLAYANIDGTWTETSLTAEKTVTSGTLALSHFILGLGSVSLSGYSIGTQVKCRIKRIAATTGTEYPQDVFITQIGVHAKFNSPGSREEWIK